MNGFGGFTNDHFAYFALGAEERAQAEDVKAGVHRQMQGLLEQVKQRSGSAWDVIQGHIRNDATDAYAALKPPARSGGSVGGQVPHLSVAIDPSGLEVFFNIETDRAYAQFTAAWESDARRFLEMLRGLSAPAETALLICTSSAATSRANHPALSAPAGRRSAASSRRPSHQTLQLRRSPTKGRS